MKHNRPVATDLQVDWRLGSAGAIRRLEESSSGDQQRLLLVHGYLNSERVQADYAPLVVAARQSGWKGPIYGLAWDGGDTLAKIQAIARRIVFLGIPVPGPHSVLIPARLGYFAYAIRRYWSDACKRADDAGRVVGSHLVREAEFDPRTQWTIAAHSLGCRLTFEILTAINGTKGIIRAKHQDILEFVFENSNIPPSSGSEWRWSVANPLRQSPKSELTRS
jgi:hypothetical protein